MFKCGHCGEKHDTVKEAQQCFKDKKQDEDVTYEFLSMGQQKFLGDLLRQFGLVLPGGQEINKIGYAEGKKFLSALIDARRLKSTGQFYTLPSELPHDPQARNMPGKVRRPTQQRLPDCEPGYYAVPNMAKPGELSFYWVKTKKGTGPYAGWTFVDSVVGGHVDKPLNGKPALDAVKAILEFGPENAGILYAETFSNCYRCNKSLTLYASRILKLGRYCASKKGLLEEWDALNANAPESDCVS